MFPDGEGESFPFDIHFMKGEDHPVATLDALFHSRQDLIDGVGITREGS